MRLRVLLPFSVFLSAEASRVWAESAREHFTLLPRRRDLVTALAPGILGYAGPEGVRHLAIDGGILVKAGDEVAVATRRAAAGELGTLRREVERMLSEEDERERTARSAVARMEAAFVRGLLEFSR
ncbi:MAG: F0F1 ATP synthase subunit epsilon [Thermodesulfobacteriota bacterium]